MSPHERGTRLRQMWDKLREEHGLDGWRLVFDGRAKRRLGQCRHTKKEVALSAFYAFGTAPWHQVVDTLLHEVAHAVVGPGHGHGPVWKRAARRLGAGPSPCKAVGMEHMPHKPWGLACRNCGQVVARRHRRTMDITRRFHTECGPHDGRLYWVPMARDNHAAACKVLANAAAANQPSQHTGDHTMAAKKKKPAKKKTAAKKKAPAKKAPVKKERKAPTPPRTKEQLQAAKEARAAMLPEAIKLGRATMKTWTLLADLAGTLQTKLGSHPLAPDLVTADWRNLALRVVRQFDRQEGVLEMKGRRKPLAGSMAEWSQADGPMQYRIKSGAKPVLDPLGRRRKDGSGFGAKPKAERKAKAKKKAPAKKKAAKAKKKAAPKKRGK